MEASEPALAHRTQQLLLPSATAQDTCGKLSRRSWILAQHAAQKSAACADVAEPKALRVSVLLEHGKPGQNVGPPLQIRRAVGGCGL